jgi:RNA 3'-terminal phosphate cyclase (ATP)
MAAGSDTVTTVKIDGSLGEGGGQVLRTSLALSLLTGRRLEISRIRAGRPRPGLQHQHLAAVRAAAAVGRAEASGAALGSSELAFLPGRIAAGSYRFATGSAGSATLVLQTVLLPLLAADGPSQLVLEGGTHNPWAPPFPFLDLAFLPLLRRMGAKVTARLERPGFYPAGGGRVLVAVEPSRLVPLELVERGPVLRRKAVAVVSRLPRRVAERELAVLRSELGLEVGDVEAREVSSPGPGNAVWLEIASDNVTEVVTSFGQKGVPAETVAGGVAAEARAFIDAGVPVGAHLADQLLQPLALGAGGRFRTVAPSGHTRTNAHVIAAFLDAAVTMTEIGGGVWEISVGGGRVS